MTSLYGPGTDELSWDQLIYAPAQDLYAPEFTSTAEATAATPADWLTPDLYPVAQPAEDVYSYAEPVPEYIPIPEPEVFSIPPAAVEPPPAVIPEYVPETLPVDPSMYAQFGFGTTGEPLDQGGFFASRNPQFALEDKQFDAMSSPENRGGGIFDRVTGDALQAGLDLYNTRIPVYSDFARDYLKPGVAAALNAQNPLTLLPLGIGDTVEAANRLGAEVVPETAGDVVLTLGPAAAAMRNGGGLAGGIAEAFGAGIARPTEALDELPRAALRGAARRFPESPGMAPDVANIVRRAVGASDEVADVAAETADEFAGNIRLEKLPEDVRQPIVQWADENPEAIDAARRGIRSDVQVLEDARTLVNDLGGNFEKLQRRWKPGEAFNAEEVTAIRGALVDSTRKVMDAAEAARVTDSTANQLALAEAILEQQRIQQVVTGVTAEAGRALRVFRQQAPEALANGDVERMQQILRAAIGNGDAADIAKLSEAIRALDINDPIAVSTFLRNVNKPGFWDYLSEYWYNSVLSGPWTHARNAIGNTAAAMTEPVRRLGSAAVDAPLARIQGRAQERFWQEAPASVVGAVHGIPEGIRAAFETIRTGFSPTDLTRVELRRNAIPGPLGKAIRIPSTALQAADSFFYPINYRMSLYANATRSARREGLFGEALQDRVAQLVTSPTPALVKRSADDAERLLFRGDPGGFAKWLMQGKEQYPALQFIIPFIKTPSNLFKFGVRNSPLGLFDVPMWKRVLAKNPEGSDELAQVLIGSMTAVGLGSLVASGQLDITAGVPTSSAERDRFYREGKLPFAVKMPGVGWVQYNQIPGLDTTLTALAAVVEGVRDGDNVDDIASQIGGTIAQSMLDRSYMSGLSDFMDAVGDPARFASRYATRQATSTVPFSSFFRQIAQAIDPTVRAPENIADAFAANLPGLTGEAPPRLTAFGEPAERGLPSPIQISPDSTSDVDAELERLGVEVTFVGRSIGGRALSDAEQRDYQELAGKKTLEILEALIADPRYAELDDAGKQKILDKAIGMARDEARDILTENNYRIPAGVR